MNVLIASQITCMLLLLVGTLFFGILPVAVTKTLLHCKCEEVCSGTCRARKGKTVSYFLAYFGGGVLLATCLLHLLPEAREGFEDDDEKVDNCSLENSKIVQKRKHHESFPLPEFTVCLGFFAVYLFEEIVHYFFGGQTHAPTEAIAIRSLSRSNSFSQPANLDDGKSSCMKSSKTKEPLKTVRTTLLHKESTFSIAALFTVAALSFHSLFEGFAVGLRPDATSTWIVFAAIAVHKYVIAFVVGLEVLDTGGKNMHVYTYMSVFSLMSPLGMAIAMITQNNIEDRSPLTVSVLNAIATGTLLYVTFFEILQREEHKDIATWVQLIATTLGFSLMATIQFASTFV